MESAIHQYRAKTDPAIGSFGSPFGFFAGAPALLFGQDFSNSLYQNAVCTERMHFQG